MNNIFDTKYDLCVVGAGPAGIILTLEYSTLHPQKKVLLIEYGKGKLGRNSLDDSIHIRNLQNHHLPYDCTNKGLGGTSSTWGGRCVNYNRIDFLERPILSDNCTWNTKLYDEVSKFEGKSADYFECGKPVFELNESNPQYSSIAEGFKTGMVTDTQLERWSPPTRFGTRYLKRIKETPGITLLENWEARNYSTPDERGIVEKLTVRDTNSGEINEVKSHSFVLAAGAQESTRLLLRNLNLFRNLSEIPKSLGKYYQGHISGKIASVKFNGHPKSTNFGFLMDEDGIYLRKRFQFKDEYLLKNNLLNTALWLDNPLYHNPSHKSGSMSFMYLMMVIPFLRDKLAPPAIRYSITKGKVENISTHLYNVVRDLPSSIGKPAAIFYKRYLKKRKLPGIFLYSKTNEYALHFHSEQIPSESNKMTLAEDGETLEIDYKIQKEEVDSIIKIHDELDRWLRDTQCGKLNYWYPNDKLSGAITEMSRDGLHQVGTIRIAKSAEKGVVDDNLKLFGCENVYVCSSAIFPTSSQANPTFFLGCFAARLAEFLN